jgi:phage gp46-like protein
MDIRTQFSNGELDWALDGYQLATDVGLTTAVLLSLFTDARAESEEVTGDAFSRRGWWASELIFGAGKQLGSKLWLLPRIKEPKQVVSNARQWSEQALQWMIEDGIASTVTVTVELQGNLLAIQVVLERPQGDSLVQRYDLVWGV